MQLDPLSNLDLDLDLNLLLVLLQDLLLDRPQIQHQGLLLAPYQALFLDLLPASQLDPLLDLDPDMDPDLLLVLLQDQLMDQLHWPIFHSTESY
jgi:hypothetical protein